MKDHQMPFTPKFNYPTIYFEKTALPPFASTIELATRALPDVEERQADWAVWWWHFTICCGYDKHDISATILKCADRLRQELVLNREIFLKEIGEELYGLPEEIYNDWVKTINIICKIASTREKCSWTGEENENDPNHPTILAQSTGERRKFPWIVYEDDEPKNQ
jgi:hypothetical protein